MNKLTIYSILFLVLLTVSAVLCSRKVEPKQNQKDYVNNLAKVIAELEFRKGDLEKQLIELDSTLAGGYYVFLLKVRIEKISVNMSNYEAYDRHVVEFDLPTSREFWYLAKPGNMLNAGVDYAGFELSQSLKGYSVTIISKTKMKYIYGEFDPID